MPTFAEMLRQRALEFANDIKQRSYSAKKRLAEIEAEKLGLEAQLLEADAAYARVKSYHPLINGDYQCPACITRTGRQTRMVRVGRDVHHERLRCPDCNYEEVREL